MSAYDEPQQPPCFGKQYNKNTRYCYNCCPFRQTCKTEMLTAASVYRAEIEALSKRFKEINEQTTK